MNYTEQSKYCKEMYAPCNKYGKSICTESTDSDGKIYCLLNTGFCDKVYNSYKNVCSCISSFVEHNITCKIKTTEYDKKIKKLVVKEKKFTKKAMKTPHKSVKGYMTKNVFRPPGGYIRYVLLLNKKDRVKFKECLSSCYNARITHHRMCSFPYSDKNHQTELQYLLDAIDYCDYPEQQIIKKIKLTLEENVLSGKNKKLSEINYDLFIDDPYGDWIADDGVLFHIKK